jgi:hypothetical protein
MEYHITRLATPHDLRVLIEVAQRSGDGLFINRVHGILGDSILAFMGVLNVEEIEVLKRMSLGMLIQHADTVGFWSLPGLPGIGAQNGMFFMSVFVNCRGLWSRRSVCDSS